MTATPSMPMESQSVTQRRPEQAQRTADLAEALREVRNRQTIGMGIGFLLYGPFIVHVLATRATSTSQWLATSAVATGVVVALLLSLRKPSIWKFPRSEGTTPPRWLESLESPVDPVSNDPENGGEVHDRWLDG
jgi:hypothetical protein